MLSFYTLRSCALTETPIGIGNSGQSAALEAQGGKHLSGYHTGCVRSAINGKYLDSTRAISNCAFGDKQNPMRVAEKPEDLGFGFMYLGLSSFASSWIGLSYTIIQARANCVCQNCTRCTPGVSSQVASIRREPSNLVPQSEFRTQQNKTWRRGSAFGDQITRRDTSQMKLLLKFYLA